jgi:DNA anti-recombination protein RmuC
MSSQQNQLVLLGDWILLESGEMREKTQSQYGVRKPPPDDPFELAKLKVVYWKRKLELAIENFDHQKSAWLSAAHNQLKSENNPGGLPVEQDEAVGILTRLKSKIKDAQEELSHWQSEQERLTPKSAIRARDITDQNRRRLSEFCDTLESIEV